MERREGIDGLRRRTREKLYTIWSKHPKCGGQMGQNTSKIVTLSSEKHKKCSQCMDNNSVRTNAKRRIGPARFGLIPLFFSPSQPLVFKPEPCEISRAPRTIRLIIIFMVMRRAGEERRALNGRGKKHGTALFHSPRPVDCQ